MTVSDSVVESESFIPGLVLLVSDTPARGLALGEALRAAGIRLVGPVHNDQAQNDLEETSAAVVVLDLSDVTEPALGLLRSLQRAELPPLVVVRSPAQPTSAIVALYLAGAQEYVAAENGFPDVLDALDRACGQARPQRRHGAEGPVPPNDLRIVIEAARQEISARALAALESLTAVVEAQDEHLAGHSMRVGELAASIASVMGRPDEEVEDLRVAGQLHDIGMVAVPSTVLRRSGPLTSEELAMVQTHPQVGARIVRPLLSAGIQSAIRGHHERWDGRGYPDGIVGEAIPYQARVLAAAEVFDALVSDRAHRGALTEAEALGRLKQLAGQALDPAVVVAAETAIRSKTRLPFLTQGAGFALEVGLLNQPDLPSAIDEILTRAIQQG